MSERIRRSQRDYGLAFKLEVVQAVEKGEMTYKQAQKQYGIQGRSTVLVWLRRYGQLDWSELANKMRRQHLREIQTMPKPQTPEQRIKQLETELERSKQQSLVYKTMLDVISKEHGVNLLKKPSPEQLKSSKGRKG